MTKKDYDALADGILNARKDGMTLTGFVKKWLCPILQTDNPSFNKEKFLKAIKL